MGVDGANILAAVFRLDEALHHLLALAAGEVAGLGADDLDGGHGRDGIEEAFLAVQRHAGPDGALQFNDIAGLAILLLDEPVGRYRPFVNTVRGDPRHEEGVIFDRDIAIQQEHGDLGLFCFLQYRVPACLHHGGNKDGVHALGNKGANGLDLVLLFLLGIGNLQGNAAFLCLALGHRGFCRPPAGLRPYLGEPHRHVRGISGGRENKGADNARQFHFLIHVTLLCDAW